VNSFYRSLLLATVSSIVVQAAPEPTFKAGSEVPLAPLTGAKWIQGEPLKAFEPDKVYIFECWATWCGPCIAAIPHINELHKKYSEKGLRIYGINVWEDGEEKVAKFVENKGDGMSYPVAYTGKGSEFENQWLKPAGIKGIPHAFVVRNGKLVTTTHPSQLTDEIINALLSGDAGTTKAATELNEIKQKRAKEAGVIQNFRKAAAQKDTDAMEQTLTQLREMDPKSPYLGSFELEIQIAKKDWPAAIKKLEDSKDDPSQRMSVTMMASRVSSQDAGDFSPEFIQALVKAYAPMIESKGTARNAMGLITISTLQWKGGDKAAALASAKKAASAAGGLPATGENPLPAAAFEKFVAAMEADKLPATREFYGWLRESMPKEGARAVPMGKVTPKAAETPAEGSKKE
jgi:thiol-disulfide isomerase/thioredoxin